MLTLGVVHWNVCFALLHPAADASSGTHRPGVDRAAHRSMRIAFWTGRLHAGAFSLSSFVAMPQGVAAPPFSILKMPVGGGQNSRQTGWHLCGRSCRIMERCCSHQLGMPATCRVLLPRPLCVSEPLECGYLTMPVQDNVWWHRRVACKMALPLLFPAFAWGIFSLLNPEGGISGMWGARLFPTPSVPDARMREVALSAAAIPRFDKRDP
jgi:hypothetical protein